MALERRRDRAGMENETELVSTEDRGGDKVGAFVSFRRRRRARRCLEVSATEPDAATRHLPMVSTTRKRALPLSISS